MRACWGYELPGSNSGAHDGHDHVCDAVSIGVAALIALGDNAPEHDEGYAKIGSAGGFYDDHQAGFDPAGISTQEPELEARLDPVEGGRRLANYLRTLTLEAQTLARACGKSHLHNLEPEALVALTIEAAAMARVPLAGTSWIPGNKTRNMDAPAVAPDQIAPRRCWYAAGFTEQFHDEPLRVSLSRWALRELAARAGTETLG